MDLISLRLPAAILEAVNARAAATGATRSDVLRWAAEAYCADEVAVLRARSVDATEAVLGAGFLERLAAAYGVPAPAADRLAG